MPVHLYHLNDKYDPAAPRKRDIPPDCTRFIPGGQLHDWSWDAREMLTVSVQVFPLLLNLLHCCSALDITIFCFEMVPLRNSSSPGGRGCVLLDAELCSSAEGALVASLCVPRE